MSIIRPTVIRGWLWAKVEETDGYVFYADHASIRKADETVTMSDLFDYKKVQVDGVGPPALSKRTEREYHCQGQKSQPLKLPSSSLLTALPAYISRFTALSLLRSSLPPLRLHDSCTKLKI